MSVLVTFDGNTYLLPTTGETGWSVPVTNFFVDVAGNAVDKNTNQSVGGTKTFTGLVNLTGGVSSFALTGTVSNFKSTGITDNAPSTALTLDSSGNLTVANN